MRNIGNKRRAENRLDATERFIAFIICSTFSNTSIVSSSWWLAFKCPKHVEQIISAVNHSVGFLLYTYTMMHGQTYIKISIGNVYICGTAIAQWIRCCAPNRKLAGSIPAVVSGFFIDIKNFRSRYGPGIDSASNRNEYQKYFLGVKAAGA